jgi:hypothetical protein
MNGTFRMLILAPLLALIAPMAQAADNERTVKTVQFDRGRSSATIKGSIKGYNYVDYQLRAGAGQTLKVNMKGSNGANYFNVLPPGSNDVAMYVGQTDGNSFQVMLPVEGVYTLRVYLMRSSARRNETSSYTLDVAVTGNALKPLPGSQDAKLPGTHYHASAPTACALPYHPEVKQCDTFIIRRDFQGTATVEVRGKSYLRRILFVQGKPVASDSNEAMTTSRRGDITEVKFGDGQERVEIFDAMLTGG